MWEVLKYYSVLFAESLVGIFGIRMYEEPRYEVVSRIDEQVEVRRYGPRLAAEFESPTAGGAGRDEAFRLLFAYIAGANENASAGRATIAMTVPVQVHQNVRMAMTVPVQTAEAGQALRMRFFLPERYSKDAAPTPTDARVRLVEVPGETIAVLRFSGSGGDFAQRQSELLAKLAGSHWHPLGAPYALYYDAPFTLPLLRRNEAAVAVVSRP
jgi:SOUL heme-binding protein